jgi:hypothetical protein
MLITNINTVPARVRSALIVNLAESARQLEEGHPRKSLEYSARAEAYGHVLGMLYDDPSQPEDDRSTVYPEVTQEDVRMAYVATMSEKKYHLLRNYLPERPASTPAADVE